MSYLKVELFDQAVDFIAAVGNFTARRGDEIVSDALRTYRWILHQQTLGRKVISVPSINSELEDECKIADLILDKNAAKKYFDKTG